MNFKIFALAIFTLLTQQISVQAQEGETKTNNKFEDFNFGILMEYQNGNFQYDFLNQVAEFDDQSWLAFGIGILGEYSISKNIYLGVSPKILFTELDSKDNGGFTRIEKIENVAVQLPIYVAYEFDLAKKVDPFISLGYAMNLNIKDRDEPLSLSSDTYSEIFLDLGFAVETKFFTWAPYFGYNRSLSDLLDLTFTDINGEVIDTSSRLDSFHIGVRFKG